MKTGVLYKEHPAMFRNHPFRFTFFLILAIPWKYYFPAILSMLLVPESVYLFPHSQITQLISSTGHTLPYWDLFPWGFGLIPLFIWRVVTRRTTLIVTQDGTIYRRGIWSLHAKEIPHSKVGDIEIDQSVFQRLVNVGKISIASASAASKNVEMEVSGIPAPFKVFNLIKQHRDHTDTKQIA